jgi:hypothetical protein
MGTCSAGPVLRFPTGPDTGLLSFESRTSSLPHSGSETPPLSASSLYRFLKARGLSTRELLRSTTLRKKVGVKANGQSARRHSLTGAVQQGIQTFARVELGMGNEPAGVIQQPVKEGLLLSKSTARANWPASPPPWAS